MSADTPPTGIPMTGEEAIKAAEEAAAWFDGGAVFHGLNSEPSPGFEAMAAAIRALLPLARTGLLVERTLAKPGIYGVEFTNPDGTEPDPAMLAVFEMIQSEEDGIGFNRIAHALTLTSAVEAALKGQQ